MCPKSWMNLCLIALFILLLSCTPQSEHNGDDSPTKLAVESYEPVDFGTFNDTILTAITDGQVWPQDPIEIVRNFINSPGARSVNILREDDRGEGADSTTVIIVEEGYEDDSLRGTWHRFRLARSPDGTWRILDVRRAYRCWRGQHQNSYSRELCP